MSGKSLCSGLIMVLFMSSALGNLEWAPYNYPNPQTEHGRCGRNKPSWVCDPNHIISKTHADNLDFFLLSIARNDTECPCSAWECIQNNQGYKMAVALVKKIKRDANAKTTDDAVLHDAKNFVYALEKNLWNFGNCDEDIVILFSMEDRVLYTMTGQTASWQLPSHVIEEISRDLSYQFQPGGNIGDGLVEMVRRYRLALKRNYFIRGPVYGAQQSGSLPSTINLTLGYLLLCVLGTMIL